ncbi:hypothetical protein FOQG_03539 [Fusarium oxysporum f. sp. raphani 54005]|uniref:Uncharacterized protein n=2 Tax=Fusarium oxysporum TaxID=5507 RepID=X0D089_FUSOX|nr:hypothetical protein FOVG_00192 [Fusarium oxysporum f. sp. pisi HDV247]EXK96534.1 hypothetical protein FOQG_03539 [Fusarium oxysporum f. sp. raphani 54005]KAJ4059054.1 hypothetical protein NW763_006483 [Fusarium oxysporum]WKT39896.1 hypothetical protein QSH57_001715 [Fusarium oxysporum f. sp. vasinfectum]KAJ4062850.1 hypothetical protein NW753_004319 [Fusarium oxysporum]
MKFAITLAALASLAAATPLDASSSSCKPGTYSCTPDNTGWQVCDVNHKYVAAGLCPPKTSCVFYKKSASPYCVPPGFKFPQA